jgi:hypothetical protein
MFKRFPVWGLLLVGILSTSLLLGACGDSAATPTPAAKQGGTGLASVKSNLTLGLKSPLADSFPSDTALYISVNTDTNSDQIKGWQKIITYLSGIPEVKAALPQLDVLASAKMGSYDADIKPWLGSELAIGLNDVNAVANLILASNSGATPSLDIPVLAAVSITDKAKLEAFITKLLTNLDVTATTETYNGFTLKNVSVAPITLSIGYNDKKLFIGGSPAIVKAAIDRTADKSLAGNDQYKLVASKLSTGYLAFIYADIQGALKSLNSNPNIQKLLNGTSLSSLNLDYVGGLGVTTGTATDGFRIDVYQSYLADKVPADVKTQLTKPANPSTIISALPDKTFLFGNGQDGKSAYATFLKSLSTMGTQSQQVTDGIKKFETDTGLSIQNDIVSLFPGEFAVFAQPLSGYTASSSSSLPLSIGALTKVTDKVAAQASIDKIAAALEKASTSSTNPVKFQPKTVNGVNIKQATVKDSNSSLNLGVTGDYAFFSTSEDQTKAIIDSVKANKTTFAQFTSVQNNLPANNQGYGYIDLQQVISLAISTLPADQVAQVKTYTDKLTAFKAIGITASQSATENVSSIYIYFPDIK